ncbi:MAG TPA: NADH-quinone oxidoreductase subunit H [Acidimicrobiales bacterium]|nr:NADH-quinone oxidoreductase subunit H [Acidimicrobiales bacterium]
MNPRWDTTASIEAATVQIVLLVVAAPLIAGLMRKVRCRMEGRVGPRIAQPWLDLRKLASKERTCPDNSSWVFSVAPLIFISTTLVICAITPLVSTGSAQGKSADLFAIVFLFLLGSVALALAGLDTGTAFGGMGASRAMTIGALSEPALLVAILALSIPAHSSNLQIIITSAISHPLWLVTPQRLLAFGAFVIVIIAEAGRIPVDNPSTHLELTMIHEAMILEYSGPDLALIKLGGNLRLSILMGLLGSLFVPWGIASDPGAASLATGSAALIAKIAVAGVSIAIFEVFAAKLRLFRVPELLAGAFVLAVIATIATLASP